MAWSWSHTSEAYDAARHNLEQLPLHELQIIYAEWRASNWGAKDFDYVTTDFNQRKYYDALRYAAENLDHDTLVDAIWNWSSELATCENGGFELWVCPYGCGPHCVKPDWDDLEPAE